MQTVLAHGKNHTHHGPGCCQSVSVDESEHESNHDNDSGEKLQGLPLDFESPAFTEKSFNELLEEARHLLGQEKTLKMQQDNDSQGKAADSAQATSPKKEESPKLSAHKVNTYVDVLKGHSGVSLERFEKAIKDIDITPMDPFGYGLENDTEGMAAMLEFKTSIRNYNLADNRFKPCSKPRQCLATFTAGLSIKPCKECACWVLGKSLRLPSEKPVIVRQLKLLANKHKLNVGYQVTMDPDFPYIILKLIPLFLLVNEEIF